MMERIFFDDDGWPVAGRQSSPSSKANPSPQTDNRTNDSTNADFSVRVRSDVRVGFGSNASSEKCLCAIEYPVNISNATNVSVSWNGTCGEAPALFIVREGKMGKGTFSFESVVASGFFLALAGNTSSKITLQKWVAGNDSVNNSVSFLVIAGALDAQMVRIVPYNYPTYFMKTNKAGDYSVGVEELNNT